MHAVNGAWVGKTFALSKNNESGGKKSRVRLSKEERKGMVESFIKRYQSLNNGDFPSLNLTHKEVGGSFYTVREIVREIIQENRVLGPAKFSLEEENTDPMVEHYPIGTISTGPLPSLSTSPNGSAFPKEHNYATEEPSVISNVACGEPEHGALSDAPAVNGSHVVIEEEFDDLKVPEVEVIIMREPKGINKEAVSLWKNEIDSDVFVKSKESDTPKVSEFEVTAIPEAEEIVKDVGALMTDVTESDVLVQNEESDEGKVAELMSEVSKSKLPETQKNVEETVLFTAEVTQLENEVHLTDNESDRPKVAEGEVRELPETEQIVDKMAMSMSKMTQMADIAVETFPLCPVIKPVEYLDGNSSEAPVSNGALKEREVKIIPNEMRSSKNVYMEDSKDVGKFPNLESAHSKTSTPLEANLNGSQDKIDVDVYLSSNTPTVGEKKVSDAQNVVQTNILATEKIITSSKPDAQHAGSLQKGSNPKLDRVNIDSWQGAPRNPPGMQANPFWAFVKSFIDAFVKFWS